MRISSNAIPAQRVFSIDELPRPPPFALSAQANHLLRTWDTWDDIRKNQTFSVVLPEDFRELFRPNTDDVAYDSLWRERFQTFKYELPPPLVSGTLLSELVDVSHCTGWPDWYVLDAH